jgi:hypothetical protein
VEECKWDTKQVAALQGKISFFKHFYQKIIVLNLMLLMVKKSALLKS